MNEIINLLNEVLDVKINSLTKLGNDAQHGGNGHIDRLDFKHDPFKESPGFDFQNHNTQIKSLIKAKNELAKATADRKQKNMFSVVQLSINTTMRNLLISPVLGGEKLMIDSMNVTVITPASPIGTKVISANIGDKFSLSDNQYSVVNIIREFGKLR